MRPEGFEAEIHGGQSLDQNKKEVQALMVNDIFSRRPLAAKTMQHCVNDVVYLPALHDTYTKRIDNKWMERAMDESARRVVDACGHAYKPQSEMKKFGPWGSGLDKKLLTMDEWLDQLDDERMDAMARESLGYDDPWNW
jgi:exonuclease 3'-5' domain-containing protein 1